MSSINDRRKQLPQSKERFLSPSNIIISPSKEYTESLQKYLSDRKIIDRIHAKKRREEEIMAESHVVLASRSLEMVFAGLKRRLCSGVFIKILHENRTRIDLKEMVKVEDQAKKVNSQLQVSMISTLFERLAQNNLWEGFWEIESAASRNRSRKVALSNLENLFFSRQRLAFRVIVNSTVRHLTVEMQSICPGAFILFRFFEKRGTREKILFFNLGKHLYEEAQRLKAISPQTRAKLIKSNSLILATTNNLYNGFLKFEKVYLKKLSEPFK
jgi:hypothetical protein